MSKIPKGFREIKLLVPTACYERIQDLKEDQPVRTVQAMLAPVVQAYSRGEIQQHFVQRVETDARQKPR